MGRTKKRASSRKNVQHQLPQFNLTEDSNEKAVQDSNRQVDTEQHQDDDSTLILLSDPEPDNRNLSDNNEDESVNQVSPRRRKATEEGNGDAQKRTSGCIFF
jgi:hypothetical protein